MKSKSNHRFSDGKFYRETVNQNRYALLAGLLFLAAVFVSGCVIHSHGHRGRGPVKVSPRVGVTVAPAPVAFVFTDHHRHVVWDYYRVHPRHPHGKKHKWKKVRNRGRGRGGPPPWARKGGNLPPGIAMQAIPYELAVQLPPAPRGTQFIFYSDHVLLVDVSTHVVLDFIEIQVGF